MSELKRVVFILCVVCFLPIVFAQEKTLDAVFADIDSVIAKYLTVTDNRTEALGAMLDSYSAQSNYAAVEMYVLKKARYYIIYANYEYARDIAYAVVDRNLDNINAAILYDAANGELNRIADEQRTVEEKQKELAAQQQIRTERVRSELRQTPEYKVTSTASGETVYFDQNVNMYYSPYIWKFAMRFLGLSCDLSSDTVGLQYGAGAEGSFFYYGSSFGFGGEILAEMAILSLAGDGAMTNTFKAAGCFGFPIKRSMLCARAGLFIHNSDMRSDSDAFISPLAGIEWRDIHIGNAALFSCYFDYFPGHLMKDDLMFAGDAGASISFPLFSSDSIVMNFSVGVQDIIMMYDNGSKNTAEFILALGVCNAE